MLRAFNGLLGDTSGINLGKNEKKEHVWGRVQGRGERTCTCHGE